MKKKTAAKPPTRKAFARRLGISRQALEHHMKNPTAPPLGDVPGWNAHLVIHGKLAALPPKIRDAMGEEKLGIARELHAKLRRENAVRDGEFISLVEIRRQTAEVENFFYNSLERWRREGPRLFLGLDVNQLRDAIGREVHEILEGSRERFQKVDGLPYVRRPYAATKSKFEGWLLHPSSNQERQLDALVAKTRCKFPESHAAMEAMLAADDAK